MSSSKPNEVVSADGTKIAYWVSGKGPTLVIVTGAFNDHNTGAVLADELSRFYKVVTYDRRGRGASGDNKKYSPKREVEDLAAIVDANGGKAAALGFSSGAPLITLAAASGVALSSLILVDTPWMVSDAGPRPSADTAAKLRSLAESGKEGDAVELFQRVYVGMPEQVIVSMRKAPFRPALEKMALTTSYDAEIMGDLSVPKGEIGKVSQPVLFLYGEKSPPFMKDTAVALAKQVKSGQEEVIPGIGHDLTVDAAPLVHDFLMQAAR